MSVTVRVRDSSLRRIAEADDYTSLELTLIHNSAGSAILTLPAATRAAQAITYAGGIVVTDDDTHATVFSGPTTGLDREGKDDGTDVLTATFADDTALLARRVVWPCAPPYTAAEYDTITGPGETVLRHYVNANAGAGAVLRRRLPSFALEPDLARGATVIGKGRWDVLLELLQGQAVTAGLGFRVRQVGSQLVFQVYVPRDLRASAVFGRDRANLSSYRYGTTAPTSNYPYAGGGGEGTARLIVEDSDPDSIAAYGLIETFVDAQGELDSAVIHQSNGQVLTDQSASSTLSLVPIDTDALRFGRDYGLGDQVSVIIDAPGETPAGETGSVLTDVLRQVKITYSSAGTVVTPTMASDGASMTGVNLIDVVRRTARTVRAIGSRR